MKIDTLVIGFDGLDGTKVSKFNSPTLYKLGTKNTVKSVHPYHTGPCWMSIYTGLQPKDHGITSGGWKRGVPYTQQLKAKTIWQQISNVGVFNMPMTWPPYVVDGWMVSGFPCIEDSEDHNLTYPEHIKEYLPDDYLSDVTSNKPMRGELEEDVLGLGTFETIRKIAKGRIPNFRKIYKEHPVTTAAIGYTFPDRFGHQRVYKYTLRLLDEILKDIIQSFEYKNLIIISDHGFAETSHSPHAICLTNFGATPKIITDVYQVIKDITPRPIKDITFHPCEDNVIRKAYNEYTTTVSNPVWTISWELSLFLLEYIKNHKLKRILDLGSGFSSYVLRQSDAEVWSVDMDEDWLEKTREFLIEYDISQENLVLLEDFNFEGEYDLIFMDIGNTHKDRPSLFKDVKNHCSGIIIFDDMHRPIYSRLIQEYFKDHEIINLHDETVDKYGRFAWLVQISGVYNMRI